MSFYTINEAKKQIELTVRAAPNSSRNEVVGEIENSIKIKLKAPPVDGEANNELVNFLSKWLKVSKSDIIIQRGGASKNKKILLPLNEAVLEKLKGVMNE